MIGKEIKEMDIVWMACEEGAELLKYEGEFRSLCTAWLLECRASSANFL